MTKKRLDQAVVDLGLLPTRAMARSWIMAGDVLVNGQRVDKPGTLVKPDDGITLKDKPRFVSRGGDKLAYALDAFCVDVTDYNCLDVGASTGGFTDCLLQAGAAHVVALDVGFNQLDWRLRHHAQVTCLEQTHIRDFVRPAHLADGFDLVVTDVSFISLMTVLPWLTAHAKPGSGQLVTLLKPQFEFVRYLGQQSRFDGVVRQAKDRNAILDAFFKEASQLLPDWRLMAMAISPLKGGKGNIEYLLWWRQV